jgi:hypothetical protein
VSAFQISPSGPNYDTTAKTSDFYRRALERIKSLPGVEAAAVTSNLPLSAQFRMPFAVEGQPPRPESVQLRLITPEYFRALRIPLRQGREFAETDAAGTGNVAVVSSSVASERFIMTLLGLFAALGLSLAAVGIYGVMSYTVAQRTPEIGVRMAIGAQASDILKLLVIRQGLKLPLIGTGLGLLGALGLTRLMKSLLFGVSVTDPLTFVSISSLLTVVALLACWIPARRATKVDPMIDLRCE